MINNTDSFVVGWRCWYNDNTVEIFEYNSLEHNLIDLPDDGFQAMRLWYKNGGGRYMSGNDYYFFFNHPNGIVFGQSNDSFEDITKRYPGASIKRGKHVDDATMHEIQKRIENSTNPTNIIKHPVSTPVV